MTSQSRRGVFAGLLLAAGITVGCGSGVSTVPMTDEQIKAHESQGAEKERKARQAERMKGNKGAPDQ